ncbi:undecaprenyl-phosphate galactose phosphotransferase WbaP [Deinococcus kurensis]|uniref:undecaprenyl-phosphate galactose phosphotransferase WbaP n=1 Tax=Deinococcus kurensis TaxID=2662757 RepID=UPI0012D2B690|nr:undecaprenyl-phosphate galactose phosphotransferase WbaP [Deinococcus kurensis]
MGILSPNSPNIRLQRLQKNALLTSVPQGLTLVLGDILSLILSSLAVVSLGGWIQFSGLSFQSIVVWGALWVFWRAYQGLYPGYGRSPQTELRIHVISTLQLLVVQLVAALAVQRLIYNASAIILTWIFLLPIALVVRYAVRSILIKFRSYGRPISVIGAGQTAGLAIAHLCSNPEYGLNPIAAYDDNSALHGTLIANVPILGSIELALANPKTSHALISIPGARAEIQQRIVNDIYGSFPHTWVIPDLFGVPNQALRPHNIGSVASLEIRNNLRSIQARLLKRLFDIIGSVIGGTLLIPILIIITIAIYFDSPGPVIYRARRLGKNGRNFDCFKFRSMHQDAEERLQQILDSNIEMKEEYEKYHKLKEDPRVTRVGSVLRRFSLDELPQIYNVIMGDMSLIGPRPYLPREQEKMGAMVQFISQVSPGMTGYWQVSGRSSSTFDERLDMDRFYITNWTPWLDVIILIRTFIVVFAGKGAY